MPARLSRRLVRALDRLVADGLYVSRSDAVRDGVRLLVRERSTSAGTLNVHRVVSEISAAILVERFASIITDIVLFGSVAAGKQTEESDIDLLILVTRTNPNSVALQAVDALYTITLASGKVVTPIVYETNEFRAMFGKGMMFAREVVDGGVQLYGGIIDELRSKKAS